MSEELKSLLLKRNKLICQLWVVLNDILELSGSDGYSDEDLNLWTKATCHSAIQEKLEGNRDKNIYETIKAHGH